MHAKILEVFKSIQGEGAYLGCKQVFVRFYECNMLCDWCDTPHSIGPLAQEKLGKTKPRYKEYSVEELLKKIESLWNGCHSVSITGGEPLLQAEFIKELLVHLNKKKYPVHLETNGTLYESLKQVIDGVDVVAMDLKLPSSTKTKEYWVEHKEFLKIALQKEVFVKTVITTDTTSEDIVKSAQLVREVSEEILFILQPNSFELTQGVINICKNFEEHIGKILHNVRIIPQVHKVLKVR